ncbi:MAG: type IV pilus modification PilV family protein [Geminicoccales bacterium]
MRPPPKAAPNWLARRQSAPARGFTLLEVLVALIVFALLFGILSQIMRTGLRRSATAEEIATASLLAQSQLERVGVEVPFEVGETSGETDGMRWRTATQLIEPEPGETEIGSYLIEVTVAWGDGRAQEVSLTTLKLGPMPEAMP